MKLSNRFNGFKPGRIKIDAKCPVCGHLYDFQRLEIIEEDNGATLMYIKCPSCQSAALSMIALGPMGVKMASILTDLEQDEVIRFQDELPLASGEVLDLHEELEKPDNFLVNFE